MPTFNGSLSNDFNGGGRSDILWRNDNGQFGNWLSNANGSFTYNGAAGLVAISNDWKIAATSDFNGDGRSDILWRNDNGQFGTWLADANGRLAYNGAAGLLAVTNDWKIIGTGDFNGDGRSDILWRNDNGQFGTWLANANASFVYNGAAGLVAVANDWKIIGTGDFNGDGRSDILWRNDNGQFGTWLANANGSFAYNGAAGLVSVTNDWKIAGTGDFNGDGRSDILWRNDNGQFGNWLANANGSFTFNAAAGLVAVSNDWKIASTGDYNGDGRSDILWRNDNGQFGTWLANANGSFTYNAAAGLVSISTDWKIEPQVTPAATTSIQSLDLGTNDFRVMLDGAGGNVTFTDDASRISNVRIVNFGAGDLIRIMGAAAGSYSFTSGNFDGGSIANDLEISFNNTAAGVVNSIYLLNVVGPNDFIFNQATATAAIGFNFISFG